MYDDTPNQGDTDSTPDLGAPTPGPAPNPGEYPPPPAADWQHSEGWPAQADPAHYSDGHTFASSAEDRPLPICDYESDEPCEEPAQVKRWSGFSIVAAATLGALFGGLLMAALAAFAFGVIPGARPLLGVGEVTGQRSGSTTTASNTDVTINPSNANNVAAAVAKKVTPSVVNVTIQAQGTNPYTGQTGYQELGNGSGVIIRSDGYILTNNHVVEGADRILVRVGMDDKEAKVVGTDTTTDLAVLKIDGGPYPAVDIGSSKSLNVGDFVMAVGSPFGLEKTVTSGIVSALQRTEQVQQQSQQTGASDITNYTNLIQTDAAINPGNSGGALVNDQGQLVGINALIQSTSGQSAGIGFAIPIDFAMQIADQLITGGKAVHPYLGVSTQTIDETLARQYNLPVKAGALVQFVQPNSPAQAAGIQRDDVIVQIGDRQIGKVEDVFGAVREYKIGDSVKIIVVRGDAKRTLTATIGSDAQKQ